VQELVVSGALRLDGVDVVDSTPAQKTR
jgi:hypothetical protein